MEVNTGFKFELIKTLVIIDVFTIGLHQIMHLITVTSIKTSGIKFECPP